MERIGGELKQRLLLPESASSEERLAFVERVLRTQTASLMPKTAPAAVAGFGMLFLAHKLMSEDVEARELETVLRGLPHNVTTEMDLCLWKLASSIRSNSAAAQASLRETPAELCRRFSEGSLPDPAQRGVADFLSQYGHRAVAEIDIGMPRWSDDPTHILGVLANYLRMDKPDAAPGVVFTCGAAAAEAAIETLATRARRRGRWRSTIARFALKRARELAGVREIPKYYMVVVLAAVRRELAVIGAELAGKGQIESPDDIFFLDLNDVRAALAGSEMTARIAERRQATIPNCAAGTCLAFCYRTARNPKRSWRPSGVPMGLAGTPASAGTATGIARVIYDPVGAHLEPGEILVAPSTDPGWTPLFLTAGALVMEMGGANSHGAVVAREYGIPAVVGVPAPRAGSSRDSGSL